MSFTSDANWGRTKGYILHHIRLAWRYYSEARKKCLKATSCAICGRSRSDLLEDNSKRVVSRRISKSAGPKGKSPLVADHIEPVVDPEQGFAGWDEYVNRMFGGRLQPLCHNCHRIKTAGEAKERKACRSQKKLED